MLDLNPLFQDLLSNVVQILAIVVAGFVVAGIRAGLKYVQVRMSREQYGFLKDAADTTVRYVEQLGVWDEAMQEGARKKERALAMLVSFAQERSLPITHEFASRLLEEAVNVMNSQLAGIDTAYPAETEPAA